MVSDYLGWFASAATMIAAMMTAANLGSRLTGWGFVVFSLGSICWAVVGAISGQTSLAVTNGFLLLVNLVGVWRWLGQQSRHEKGGETAVAASRAHPEVPNLFSAAALIGAQVVDADGKNAGVVVDSMVNCDSKKFSYFVIGQGGLAGAGETLYAIEPQHFQVARDAVQCALTSEQIAALPSIPVEAWPPFAPTMSSANHRN